MAEASVVRLRVNGREASVAAGGTVAVALLNAGFSGFRQSVSGEPRGPLCGMGICFECRVTIDGRPQQKSCQIAAVDGMVVETV